MPVELIWFLKASLVYGGLLGTAAAMTLAERKVSAWIQWRIGPNRVGPWGLLQPLADGVKFIFKEELIPDGANSVYEKELRSEMTIVLVTNLVQQARRLANRTAFFLTGELVEVADTESLFTGDSKDPRTRDYVEGRFG